MKLNILNRLENSVKMNDNEIKNFIDELYNYLKGKIVNQKGDVKNMQEEGLYYVLSGNPEKVYLTKFKSKKVFEATDLPDEIKNAVSEGFILRYKNGEYSIDEELTDKNFEGELNIDEYEEE